MAWDIPSFNIPVQVNQGQQIASWGDRLMGAYDQGRAARQQQDVLSARKALGQEMAQAGGAPNYQSYAQRLMGSGDLEGANTMMRLGQQEVQNNFERQKLDIMRQNATKNGQPTYGLTPQFGTDANGKTVMMQLGNDGSVKQVALPQGVQFSNKPIVSDAGTHFVLTDPITRQPVGMIPKNVAGAAAEKAVGTAAGEARAQIPGAEGMASQIGRQIDELANDPYLPNMVGPIASHLPNLTSDSARVQSRMDQLSGGAFLQARQMLKGGGAITDFESQKAEAAYARLNSAQSVADYRAALNEFKGAITAGLAKLKAQSGMVPGGGQPAGTGGAPASSGQGGGALSAGTVVNGFVYRGGNPNDPNSWGRAQ